MPPALILEIEECLFDTRVLRAQALHAALAHEGIECSLPQVLAAHAGAPASVAMQQLDEAHALDAVGADLVLRRAADAARDAIARAAPVFDAAVRDAIERLAGDFPLAVVTRAERSDAQHLLELAGLDASVRTIRSLADVDRIDHHRVWEEARRRTHAARGVALAPGALLGAARQAGLATVQVGDGPDAAACPRLVSLATVDASFIASLD